MIKSDNFVADNASR